ncbi:MAG: O-methyltransferase [Acidobacteriota bacterium]
MKHGADAILRTEQATYLDRLLPPRDPLRREMEQVAAERKLPISDPEVGRLLGILARSIGARRILEVGTSIGYGTLCLARAAAEAKILSIDADAEILAEARGYLERGGVLDRVELVHGEALAVLGGNSAIEGPFDLVYLDAVKTEYRRYLDLLLPKVRVGGLVVVDNLLWGGEVATYADADEDDEKIEAIQSFNGYFMIHPQLEAVVLPLGDGVGLATKTKPLILEMGGPY